MSEDGANAAGVLPADLRRELDAVVAAVAAAERRIAAGETVDLMPHQTQVADLCERLRGLPVAQSPEVRQAALEALSYIAGRFDRLARTVEAQLADLNRRLDRTAPDRAAAAYRRPDPGKS